MKNFLGMMLMLMMLTSCDSWIWYDKPLNKYRPDTENVEEKEECDDKDESSGDENQGDDSDQNGNQGNNGNGNGNGSQGGNGDGDSDDDDNDDQGNGNGQGNNGNGNGNGGSGDNDNDGDDDDSGEGSDDDDDSDDGEQGDNGDGDQGAPITYPSLSGCDIFDETKSPRFEYYRHVARGQYNRCQKNKALSNNASDYLYNFVESFMLLDARLTDQKCEKRLKRMGRRYLHMKSREFGTNPDTIEKRMAQVEIDKVNLDRDIVTLYNMGCLENPVNEFTYHVDGNQKTYVKNENLLMNPNLENFHIRKNDDILERLERGRWEIFSSSHIRGWKVKSVQDTGSLDCNFLEVQKSGVTTTAIEGKYVFELDSACRDEQGRRVNGPSEVEISQRFPIAERGIYSLRFKAQKRSGRHGALEVGFGQKYHKLSHSPVVLQNQASFQEVCVEYEALERTNYLTVSIRDNDLSNPGLGVLLDDVIELKKKPCSANP